MGRVRARVETWPRSRERRQPRPPHHARESRIAPPCSRGVCRVAEALPVCYLGRALTHAHVQTCTLIGTHACAPTHTHTDAHMYRHTRALTHALTHMYTHSQGHMPMQQHALTQIHTCTDTCMCTNMNTRRDTYTCTNMHVHTNTHTDMHTHRDTCTLTSTHSDTCILTGIPAHVPAHPHRHTLMPACTVAPTHVVWSESTSCHVTEIGMQSLAPSPRRGQRGRHAGGSPPSPALAVAGVAAVQGAAH